MKPLSFSQKKHLFNSKYLSLYSVSADFGAYSKEYTVVKGRTRVGIIVEQNGSLLLVKQYRYAIDSYSWEIPSGGIDGQGEDLKEAAIRECLEETGIRCRNLNHIYEYITGVDVIDSRAHIYVSNDFEQVGDFDTNEISENKWFDYNECLAMVLSGEIKDVYTILAIFMYGTINQNLQLKSDQGL